MTTQPVDPISGRLLWAMYASGSFVLLSLVLMAAMVGTGWSWPIFGIGIAVAAATLALNHLMLHFARRRMLARWHLSQERHTRVREEIRRRQRIYPVIFTMLVGIAILSAALETFWLIGLAALVVVLVVVVLPLALLPLIMRRSERRMFE